MRQHTLLALLVTLAVSCSQVRLPVFGSDDGADFLAQWRPMGVQDYADHLASYGEVFLGTEGVKELPLSKNATAYLEGVAMHILQNNELFFAGTGRPRFHVVLSETPFHFSLPGRRIFLSSSLVEKFIKHEAVMAAVIAYELIRSDKLLYNRVVVVPIGYLPLERVLGLNRLSPDDKVEIHKWAYHCMRRAGFDGEYYLSWLQLMNRNSAHFILQLGDSSSISREEAMFKAFMIRRAKNEDARAIARRESSKDFYRFVFYVKDHSS